MANTISAFPSSFLYDKKKEMAMNGIHAPPVLSSGIHHHQASVMGVITFFASNLLWVDSHNNSHEQH